MPDWFSFGNDDSDDSSSDGYRLTVSNIESSDVEARINTDFAIRTFNDLAEDVTIYTEADNDDTTYKVIHNERITPGSQVEQPMNSWWLNEALATHSATTVGEAYVGEAYDHCNGFDAIKLMILEGVSERVTDSFESGDRQTLVGAFNSETHDWPQEARAVAARYEADHADLDDDDFIEKAENFANGIGIEEISFGNSNLGDVYPDNPFEDFDVDEGHTIMEARAVDGPISRDFIDDVNNHRQFREELEEVENVEVALRVSQFDPAVPREVLGQALPPDEWESDPDTIRQSTCCACGEIMYEIETPTGDLWAGRNDLRGGHRIDEEEQFSDILNHNAFICNTCYEDRLDTSSTVTIIAPEEDANISLTVTQHFVEHDEDPEQLPHGYAADAVELGHPSRSPPGGYFTIRPDTSIGPATEQIRAIREIAESPDEIDAGPVFIIEERDRAAASVERTNIDAAQSVKSVIETYV